MFDITIIANGKRINDARLNKSRLFLKLWKRLAEIVKMVFQDFTCWIKIWQRPVARIKIWERPNLTTIWFGLNFCFEFFALYIMLTIGSLDEDVWNRLFINLSRRKSPRFHKQFFNSSILICLLYFRDAAMRVIPDNKSHFSWMEVIDTHGSEVVEYPSCMKAMKRKNAFFNCFKMLATSMQIFI